MTEKAEIPGGVERRRHRRYRVKEGALAFLGTVPGSISDISEGGLAVHYVVFEKQPGDELQLDIFFGRDDFYLTDLPGRKVSEADSTPGTTFSRIRVRRMGVQFGELTSEQKSRLRYFILHNTLGVA
ncbi:PilZ domain-containing protein [Thermodesulfobacteriota bacterium B35]